MHFSLFGFDFFPKDKLMGFWFCSFGDYDEVTRSLFGMYMDSDMLHVDIFFYRMTFC